MSKHLIVLIIDDETFTTDQPDGEHCTPSFLLELGKSVNDSEAGIYGYESWIVVHDVDQETLDRLAEQNIPLPEART